MGAESIQARMSHLGASALLYGRVQETEEIISLYDSATRAQLRDLAREIFHWDLASLSAFRTGGGRGPVPPLAGGVIFLPLFGKGAFLARSMCYDRKKERAWRRSPCPMPSLRLSWWPWISW